MSKVFNEWKESRKINSIPELPLKFRDQLDRFIKKYHPTKITLIGSFANGDWITEDTPQYYRNLKRQIKYKDKISDLDIIVEPHPGISNFDDIHINQVRTKGTIIYA